MGRIEKTVFISYRRTNYWTALAIFQNLNANGYDVFFDYKSIPSGDFEQVIIENIKSRAHFIVVLSPSALERCNEPGDWLRREMETAIDNQRNIIPLMMEGFDFGSPSTLKALTGKLDAFKKYNGLGIPAEYFDEAMAKLRSERFLNKSLESVSHPVAAITKQITEEQKSTASEAAPVEATQLTAEEWFERGYKSTDTDEKIHYYTEAILLNPDFSNAYCNRGVNYQHKGDLESAVADFNEAIRLKPDYANAYNNRGAARSLKSDIDGAIKDFNEAIRLKPDLASAYFNRALSRNEKEDLDGAIQDYTEVIRLRPDYFQAYGNRGFVFSNQGALDLAINDYSDAIRITQNDALPYYYRGNARHNKGQLDDAINDYNEAIRLKPDYADAFNSRGTAYLDKSNIDNAIKDFEEAIRIKPDHILAHENLNIARALKGIINSA